MWKIILYIFLMSILTTGLSSLAPDAEIEAMFLSSKGNDFYGKLSNISSTFAPTALLPLEEFEAFSDKSLLRKINRKCIEDSRHYVESLWNESEWALSMYHASGRVSIDESTNFLIAGLGINVHQDPGLFDQCIATISPSGRIRGQYCSVFLSAQTLLKHNNSSFLNEPKVTIAERPINNGRPVNTANSIIGFCLPSSCSAKDIRTAVAHKIGRTTFRTKNKNGTVTVQSIVTSNHDRLCNSQIKIQDQHALDATCIAFM